MQASVSRQDNLQTFLSITTFMLILCYYAFNGIPQDTFEAQAFAVENPQVKDYAADFEKSICQLRAAVLMDADMVQVNGLLYEVEVALTNLTSEKEAKKQVLSIYNQLLTNDRKKAIRKINQLHLYLLKK